MKGGWRPAGTTAACLVGWLACALPAASDDSERLSPYADAPVADVLSAARYTPAGLGGGMQVSLMVTWTHHGYGGPLKPKGFGAGLRLEFGAGEMTNVFLEARVGRSLDDEILPGFRDTDIVFDTQTAALGLSIILPGSELTTETGDEGAIFWHQIEFGAGFQSFLADEDTFDINGMKIQSREVDEGAPLALVRYRVGSAIGEAWYMSFTGGIDAIRREQFLETGQTEPTERWDVDVTFSVMIGFDW